MIRSLQQVAQSCVLCVPIWSKSRVKILYLCVQDVNSIAHSFSSTWSSQSISESGLQRFSSLPVDSLRDANEFFEQFSLTSSLESTITDCKSKENVTFRFLNFCSSFWNFSIPIYMLTKSCDHMMTLWIGLDTEYKQTSLTSCFNSFCRLPLLWSFPHLRFTTSVDFCSELHCVISIFNLGTEFLLFKILPCLVRGTQRQFSEKYLFGRRFEI